MTARSPAMKPPTDASDLLNVPMTISTSSSTPRCSAAPAPVAPEHADAVRFVHVDARAVGLGELHDAAQIGDIAFHAEDAFGDDQNLLFGRAVFQAALEVVHVVVAEPHGARRRPQRAFHQAGVQVVVADHHVALFGERARGWRSWPGIRCRK